MQVNNCWEYAVKIGLYINPCCHTTWGFRKFFFQLWFTCAIKHFPFVPGNQSTCPKQEKAKVEARVEEEEEQHEVVQDVKLDSWRCLVLFVAIIV